MSQTVYVRFDTDVMVEMPDCKECGEDPCPRCKEIAEETAVSLIRTSAEIDSEIGFLRVWCEANDSSIEEIRVES